MATEPTQRDALNEHELLDVLRRLKNGDFTRLMPAGQGGITGEIADTVNALVRQLNPFAHEITRVVRELGTEGLFGGQAEVQGLSGTWKDLVDNVNLMAAKLTDQTRSVAEGITAIANGDFSRQVTVEARGELGELKETINTMGEQFNACVSEVSRVSREAAGEKLSSPAQVKGVAGGWRELIDNVNSMAGRRTG